MGGLYSVFIDSQDPALDWDGADPMSQGIMMYLLWHRYEDFTDQGQSHTVYLEQESGASVSICIHGNMTDPSGTDSYNLVRIPQPSDDDYQDFLDAYMISESNISTLADYWQSAYGVENPESPIEISGFYISEQTT